MTKNEIKKVIKSYKPLILNYPNYGITFIFEKQCSGDYTLSIKSGEFSNIIHHSNLDEFVKLISSIISEYNGYEKTVINSPSLYDELEKPLDFYQAVRLIESGNLIYTKFGNRAWRDRELDWYYVCINENTVQQHKNSLNAVWSLLERSDIKPIAVKSVDGFKIHDHRKLIEKISKELVITHVNVLLEIDHTMLLKNEGLSSDHLNYFSEYLHSIIGALKHEI